MKLLEEKKGDVLVVKLEDARLDSSIASEVKTELLRLMERQGVRNLLIDLSQVEYADSSGLGALLFGHRQATANGGELKLATLHPKVMTLVKIAKLDGILEWYDTEAAALKSFKQHAAR